MPDRQAFGLMGLIGACAAFVAVTGMGTVPAKGQRAAADTLWQQMERGTHVGSFTDALVGVEVTATSADGAVKKVYRGDGLILRCDGFVLIPTTLFRTAVEVAGSTEEGRLSINVVVHPGREGETRVPAHRPKYERQGLGITVAKMDRWHGPAMITEAAGGVKANDRLELYWSEWDSAAQKWSAIQHRTAPAGAPPAEPDENRPGRRAFGEAVERLPAGALVCSQSGRAVGVTLGGSAEKGTGEFLGMEALRLATNCVVPENPAPEQAKEAGGAGADNGKAEPAMVKVPGGPVLLPVSVLRLQPDMAGAWFACVAPFEIDRFEVTNRQYLDYWNSLPRDRRGELGFQSRYWPASWSKRREPFPQEIADFPVLGVPQPGAEGYARSQGKRLPTPYEWCLAALGPRGAVDTPQWIANLVRDRQSAWERAVAMHFEYKRVNLQQIESARGPEMAMIPWIAQSPDLLQASLWSKRTVEQLTEPVRRQYFDPDYLAAAGAREVDESPYGARDMLLNASEMVVTYPGAPTRANPRFMESQFPLPGFALDPNTPFTPRPVELAVNAPYDFPPLSRLFRRMIHGPSTPDLVAWSNVAEVQRILLPPSGWKLEMTNPQPVGYTGRPAATGLNALGRAAGLKPWEELPPHHRIEMGLPIPIDEIDRRIPSGPSLFYMPAAGFRCVRAAS